MSGGVGSQYSEVGDDRGGSCSSGGRPASPVLPEPDRRHEVDGLNEHPLLLAQHDEDLTGRGGDLGSATGTGKAYLRCVIGTDDGAVEIAEAIDLGSGQEADVDPPCLEPVREDLGNTDHRQGGRRKFVVADRERQDQGTGADRPRLVDEDQVGCMGQSGKVGRLTGKPDADETDGPIGQMA